MAVTAYLLGNQFLRLVEVLRPGSVMLMIEGYFDESGDLDTAPGIFCLSGYFIETEAAKAMHTEWVAVLEKYKLGYFHMVDCAHGNDGFEHLDKTERVAVVTELIALIKKYTIEGFSIFAKADGYQKPDNAPDVYSDCASGCVVALQVFLKMNRTEAKISYFFEKGHNSAGNAYNHVAKTLRKTDTVTFAEKIEVPLLQAADLLAWQSTKYAKDWLYPRMRGETPKRNPRKDFASLMEHSHSFMYMDSKDGERTAAIELWPLSKRSQASVSMSFNSDGPVIYFREEDSQLPIIPIDGTVGFRVGGSRMAYVAFEDMQNKRFALAFDEPRLFEAMAMLIDATSIYENSEISPVFIAETATVTDIEGTTVMRIKLHKGASIAFHLPTDVVERLKAALANKDLPGG